MNARGQNNRDAATMSAPRRELLVDMYPASGVNRYYRKAIAWRRSLSAGS